MSEEMAKRLHQIYEPNDTACSFTDKDFLASKLLDAKAEQITALKKDVELSDKLCPIGKTNSCGYWAKLQAERDAQAEQIGRLKEVIDTIATTAWNTHKMAMNNELYKEFIDLIIEHTEKAAQPQKGE